MYSSLTTIIIPVYARSSTDLAYLEECLNSCVPQAPVVVVNDGSLVSIASIERCFPGAHFVNSEHRGKSYARNLAAQRAETRLIFPVDADDKIQQDAISILEKSWRNVPLYPDVIKWYNDRRNTAHHLPVFLCEHVTGIFGVSSVNVLHSKEQWSAVGGWDENFNLYEDWLYNAKLFWLFCGQHIAQPLVYYRQHDGQSTKHTKSEGTIRREVKQRIAQFAKENKMACCGKRRRQKVPDKTTQSVPSFSNASSAPPSTSDRYGARSALPAADTGRIVMARYVGGQGHGSHYYRDPDTRHAYRVKHGLVLQVDIADTTTQAEHDVGRSKKRLIRIETPQVAPTPQPEPVIVPDPTPLPIPGLMPRSHPDIVASMQIKDDFEPLPRTVRELKDKVSAGITLEQAKAWVSEELKKEKPRISFVKVLEKMMKTKPRE